VRILFDQGTPDPLRKALARHEVASAYEKGWSQLKDEALLSAAEREGYAVLVTTDSNLKYQQNLRGRSLGIVVLLSTSWPRIQQAIGTVVAAIEAAAPGSYTEIEIPYRK
jgi:predicted nuclease of predicted toxin-antitoxin system